MNAWPITQRPVVNFELEQENNVLSSEQTNGIVVKRLRFPIAREKTMSFTWQYISETDYAALMTFYGANAALPFNFTYYTRQGSTTKTVTFAEPPKRTYVGMGWEVKCTFEEV